MSSSSLYGSYAWTDSLKGVYFGPGSVKNALPKLIKSLGSNKALIVTGKSLHDKTDVVKTVENILKEHNAFGATFYEIGEHSPIAGIRKGVKAFKDAGADLIVSIGGGSPIDASKAILYYLQEETGGPFKPQIAIPTLLSAAEYSIVAGYTNDQGVKTGVVHQELAPAGVILDAELTLASPERLWLSTGIRALDHAVEMLYKEGTVTPVKVLCYAAIIDLFKYLPESKANPRDVEVRQKLLIAAWMSLWPTKVDRYTGIGPSHVLGHRLGARYSIPHGITSCMTLPPTVAIQARFASQEDKENLAKALWYLHEPSTGSVEGDVIRLSELIQELVNDLGLKSDLQQYNVPIEDIPGIAEQAVGSTNAPTYDSVVKLLEGLHQDSKL